MLNQTWRFHSIGLFIVFTNLALVFNVYYYIHYFTIFIISLPAMINPPDA
jgi:hypothetical protein